VRTSFEFVLPRGYIDDSGAVHRRGVMRLATARDELEPLRDPTITGPDDPRLTIIVLARVVERLGDHELVTTHEIEGLFAADLAYLQDFYGVVNFGSDEDIDALLAAQQEAGRPASRSTSPSMPGAEPGTGLSGIPADSDRQSLGGEQEAASPRAEVLTVGEPEGGRRSGRRGAIEEVPSSAVR
jgi:hypothetical protein